ncbi:hypothetical protein [Hymenobacter sp. CRA2]|uniref:hypothetical protein n=1 Tax=Hymenobacter sp. CRA2 TaxID=1955620 RepID=UPI00098F8E05|nr:hypothetical protein [Hymenobacter sp. CRA2]OON67702.1 hypothetical protein B0919_15995 [Hymenobacter sp. CRA2]
MPSKQRAWWLLGLVAACLLLANALPAWQKLWFVTETGRISSSNTLTALLLMGLYLRWHPARALLIILTGLSLLVTVFALSYPHPGHMLGYAITAPLHLVALAVLLFSTDIRHYLAGRQRSAQS